MSIFTTLDYSMCDNPFDPNIRKRCQPINPQKIVGKCYSHSVYREISESSLNTISKLNQNLFKEFTIYRKGADTLAIARVDGILECGHSKFTVYDVYKINKSKRYTFDFINYCIDEIQASEICNKNDGKEIFENADLVAHGQWGYYNTGIMYFGRHVKSDDMSNPFQMYNLTHINETIWPPNFVIDVLKSAEDVNK